MAISLRCVSDNVDLSKSYNRLLLAIKPTVESAVHERRHPISEVSNPPIVEDRQARG